MAEKIYIGVAWPYANGSLHLGHIAGCYLPADIFARFQRMIGNDVLMVSGSDEHGTPITITAEKQQTTPQAIVDRYHKEHTENMKQFGISFDLFTRTTTKNHEETVHDIFLTLKDKGYIYTKEAEAFYCSGCKRFLPDRYLEGRCPHCGKEGASGDQCDECGKLLDTQELLNVTCKLCGGTPELHTTEHFFFSLSAFESKLLEWIKNKTYWKASVLHFTKNWLEKGLKDRAITRDMSWGIPVPVKGFEEKRIYVWFDAVIGYLAASKEWAQKQNDPDKWKGWWTAKGVKHYYFLAKDNIPFHSLIWPSMLMGYDTNLQLPYDIPANEYLLLKGEQFSKSRGLAVWVPDVLNNVDVDAVRYYLSINMPENKDTNWVWEDFVTKNNDELVGTYGNFIHRVVTFTANNFGKIPAAGPANKEVDAKIAEASKNVSNAIARCEFKKGLKEAMALAQFGNVYFDQQKPWKLIKTEKEQCGFVLHHCLRIAQALAVYMAPYLPFSSDTLWTMLGHEQSVHYATWGSAQASLHVETSLEKPKPLFKKLTLADFMQEAEDSFAMLDLRVAQILDVKDHPQADKLYLLHLTLGVLGKRVIVAGMKPYYAKEELTGKKIVVVSNLKPATIRGVNSNGMLLAAEEDGVCSLLDPGDATPGSEVFAKGIPHQPKGIVEFEDFKKVPLQIGDKNRVMYGNRVLQTEKGVLVSDKSMKKGTKIL